MSPDIHPPPEVLMAEVAAMVASAMMRLERIPARGHLAARRQEAYGHLVRAYRLLRTDR